MKKMRAARAYRGTYLSDRRISYKFPERTRAVRYVKFAREITQRSKSGIGTLKCPVHLTTKTPKSRDAISRFDRGR
jgi:hypothetical protein